MRPIETSYKGYRFRSRLEARWAIFLDELGWQWDYEKEGFVLEDGTHYLPDFYISCLNTWLEVKPDGATNEDERRCELLSKGLGENGNVMLVSGLPARVGYNLYFNGALNCKATLTTYIRAKGWNVPYLGGDWWEGDEKAFESAKKARFEYEERK